MQNRYQFQGFPISVETAKGQTRSGIDPGGKPWSITMQHDYGYIRGTTAADHEEIDCYIGPNRAATAVFVVKQHDISKVSQWPSDDCPVCAQHVHDCACLEFFDEDKVFIGFDSKEAVKAAYLAHYDNHRFLGPIEEWPVADYRQMVTEQRQEKENA